LLQDQAEHVDIVEFLTRYVKNYDNSTHLSAWQSLLGTDASVRSLARVENLLGQTPIVLAALQGHGDVVQYLPQWEDVSSRSEVMFGLFPIQFAAQRGSVATHRLLAEGHNAETDVLDPKGYHTFHAGSFDYSLRLETFGGTKNDTSRSKNDVD
jgi:hypothetical protein